MLCGSGSIVWDERSSSMMYMVLLWIQVVGAN